MRADRLEYLDILRIVATFGVLFNHIPLAAVHIYDRQATDIDRWIVNANVHVMHFAVPLFVMITGALLLHPSRVIGYRKVLTKYVWRMMVILATVGVLFAWMELFFSEKHFSLAQVPMALLNTLEGHSWKHLWYLYMLIGLYLVLPLLKSAVSCLSSRQLDCLIGLGFLFASVLPGIAKYTGVEVGIKFPVDSIYVFYMLLGYRLSNTMIPHWKKLVPIIGFMALAYVAFGYVECVMGHKSLTWLSGYYSPMMAFYAVLLFIVVKEAPINYGRFLRHGGGKFARDSFGIYVFHMLWVNIIYKVLKFSPIEHGLWVCIIILFLVTALSWLTTIIFRNIPYLGKYI